MSALFNISCYPNFVKHAFHWWRYLSRKVGRIETLHYKMVLGSFLLRTLKSLWSQKVSFGECDQIWRNFASLANYLTILKIFFNIWQNFEPSLKKIVLYWLNFMGCKWPNIKKNLDIWSHCKCSTLNSILIKINRYFKYHLNIAK